MHILWLAPYTPWPLDSGGRIRLYHLAMELSALGHTIDMRAVGDIRPDLTATLPPNICVQAFTGRVPRGPTGRLRSLMSRLPLPAWTVLDDSEHVMPLARENYDVAVLEQSSMGAYAPLLEELGLPWVLDAQNIEAAIYLQLRDKERRARTRALLTLDGKKMRRLERSLFRNASAVVAMSAIDASRIAHDNPEARVVVHPSGVDNRYFVWSDHTAALSGTIVMTASFGYGPNADAARWLITDVWPSVRRRIPSSKLILVGRDPPDDIVKSIENDWSVTVTGSVPDVRPYLRKADLFIAPLRSGSGTRLKVLEALATGVPVVATSRGVEGLGLEDSGLVLIADSAEDIVAAVDRGLSDTALRLRMTYGGRDYIEAEFAWRPIARGFAETLCEVGKGR